MISPNEYAERRQRAVNLMESPSIMILYSGVEKVSSADEGYPFEVNRNFYYLTELFGDDIVIDTNCVDSTGKSIVGREFAKLIDVLADCQDVIGFAYSLEANGSNMRALEKSFSHMCSLETPNHEKQLVKLLTAFADNKILNPEVGGKKNTNFYGLFKNVFAKLNMESNELSASMEAIICSDTFDAESEVTSFVNLIDYMCSEGILGSVSNFTIDSMSEICFEELFSKIDGSELLGTILGTVIDSSLESVDIFTYVNDYGVTVLSVTGRHVRPLHQWSSAA